MSSDRNKPKKHINFTKNEINNYLKTFKRHIKNDNYSISKNRKENMDFIEDYKINTKKEKNIFLHLTYKDFCYAVDNNKPKYSHEILYVFCKQEKLDYWGEIKLVNIYIKINMTEIKNKTFAFVVSFHEKNKPISYLFSNKGYF